MTDFKRNLVESADAAARVGVLLVAVVLFAAIWESDSTHAEENWLARRAEQETPTVATRDAEDLISSGTDTEVKRVSTSSRQVPTLRYPIPSGIVAGRYRVVDSEGDVQALQITDEMTSGSESNRGRDFYQTQDGNRMVYFIRIRNENAIADLRKSVTH